MAEEHLSLKWNNHQAHFVDILTFLREKGMFVDVTLACGGKIYSAHKFVLSTCSDYFQKIFSKNTSTNPIVFMKDVSCNDIEALLDFMYHGEVNVPQSSLGSLIKTAEGLQIKGLAVPDDPPSSRKKQDRDKRERDPSSSSHYESRSPPPKRRSRNSPPPPPRRSNARAIPPPVEACLDNDTDDVVLRNSEPSTNNHDRHSSSGTHNKKLHQRASHDSSEDLSSDGKGVNDKDLNQESHDPEAHPASGADDASEQDAGPSGLRQSKQEEVEIKQEDVVELGEDDDDGVDWGGGMGDDGGGGDGNNDGLNSGDNSVSFSDVLLPPPEGGGGLMDGTGTGDSAMAGPPPADAVAPTSASFFEDFAPSASHSLDLAAIGSVYQSLFALSGAALQQGATSASLHTPISSTSSPENKLKSLSSDGRAGLSGLIPFGIVDDVDERPFPCPFCESRFKKKQHLQNHERIHTGEKYLCSMCGQGFSRRHILKHHIYRKHLNNPRCGVTNSLSGPSDKNGSYSGSTPLSPPHFALLPMLQSNSNRSLKTNNFHPTSGNSQSNGDDAAATGSDLLPHAGGTATDVDSALMDELPDTVASLLSSATVATGVQAQRRF
ncbi:longitudinals lacking protein, isoforms A/B/D/L isoform X1 [Hyalella azteca]|uniref:Longitudinals lacking protein, isoforms A/B/D/L isoform X1 n=1 Tax=Hyalella azteca TaxID=294128 RepID=A0A8B7PFE8_HYAAZ|nr:longitudinals lacking protein, isoforms A/B/D/L isoform X1 [Hyalella azteca]